MIVTEYPHNGRMDRIKHYSDSGLKIMQNETGVEYDEAVDVYPCKFTYTETNNPVEMPDDGNNI